MKNLISVEGYPSLYRDPKTGAIINCDTSGYSQYIQSINNRKKSKNEIKELKKELNEIKSLLKELINESQ
jgi:hypothetical protein|tara:strand:- start:1197 stop:1406 length:210 start_codon:yes stop_codon:yes gene_type:complete